LYKILVKIPVASINYRRLYFEHFQGCTLSGAMVGIEYFLGLNGKGDWSKLTDTQVWVNAAAQVLGSIGIGFGSLIDAVF